MASDKLNSDGLRYTHKKAGSEFVNGARDSNFGKSALSCLLCGKLTTRDQGRNMKYFGKSHFVCFACKPDKIPTDEAKQP